MTTTNDARPVVLDHVIGDRGRLEVHLPAAEIRLAATAGDRVTVRTPAGRSLPDRIALDTSDDGVTIRERDGRGISFGRQRVVQLEIELPAQAEVSVQTASGWLDAVGLTGEQRFRTASGDTRIRGGAGRIELNSMSGDATIDLDGPTDLAIKSISGDTVVRGGRLDALRIGTTSGDVRIDSPLAGRADNRIETLSGDVEIVAASGLRVEARTVSGDLTSDLPHRSEGRMGRRTLIVGDGSIELSFRSVSGDLRIHGSSEHPVPSGPFASSSAAATPFSIELPEMPEMPEMPETPEMPEMPEMPALADLRLPGFIRSRLDRSAPAKPGEVRPAGESEAATAADPAEERRMDILRALESGELDVPTAMDRLAALDDGATDGAALR